MSNGWDEALARMWATRSEPPCWDCSSSILPQKESLDIPGFPNPYPRYVHPVLYGNAIQHREMKIVKVNYYVYLPSHDSFWSWFGLDTRVRGIERIFFRGTPFLCHRPPTTALHLTQLRIEKIRFWIYYAPPPLPLIVVWVVYQAFFRIHVHFFCFCICKGKKTTLAKPKKATTFTTVTNRSKTKTRQKLPCRNAAAPSTRSIPSLPNRRIPFAPWCSLATAVLTLKHWRPTSNESTRPWKKSTEKNTPCSLFLPCARLSNCTGRGT